jgi:hypothetical protein
MERSSIEVVEMENMDELSDHFKRKKGGIITMPFIFGTLLRNARSVALIFFSPFQ